LCLCIVVVVMLAVQHIPQVANRPVQLLQRIADDHSYLVHYMHIHKVRKYICGIFLCDENVSPKPCTVCTENGVCVHVSSRW